MRVYQRIFGAIWLFLGLVICLMSYKLNLGSASSPGSGFFPFLTGCLLILLSLIYLIKNFFFPEIPQKVSTFWEGIAWKKQVSVVASLIAYVLLLPVLGYPVITFLFIFFLIRLIEPVRWTTAFVLSAATVGITYLIFVYWLLCQFPKGIFYGRFV